MKKLLMTAVFLAGAAQAAAADCETIHLDGLRTILYYEKAVFPNKPKLIMVEMDSLKKPMSICGIVITKSPQGFITVKAPNLKTILSITDTTGIPNHIVGSKILAYYNQYLWRDIGDFSIELSESIGYNMQAGSLSRNNGDLAVGVTFDGGKIQPLYYNGEVSIVPFPMTTRVIDLYASSTYRLAWQRVTLDLKNAKLTIYRKAKIPGN